MTNVDLRRVHTCILYWASTASEGVSFALIVFSPDLGPIVF